MIADQSLRHLRSIARILTIILGLASLPGASQAQTWERVSNAGFGSTDNKSLSLGTTYYTSPTTYIVFGTSNSVTGGQVWKSSDMVSWNQVGSSGFDVNSGSNTAVGWVASFYSGLLAGVSDGSGARVYRSSTTLDSWTMVFSTVTGGSVNLSATESYGIFGDKIYIGVRNGVTGAEIWRSTSAAELNDWSRVVNTGFGIGYANQTINSFATYGGALFAATGSTATGNGQIWRTTDGTTWTQVLVASNTFDANTMAVTFLQSATGYLYAGTSHGSGAQLWRSNNPVSGGSWTQMVSGDGLAATRFSAAQATAVKSMVDSSGVLWVAMHDATAGTRIYRSTEGATFTNSNIAGFSDANNVWVGGIVSTASFIYAGTRNDAAGGAVWRSSGTLPGTPTLTGTVMGISSINWTWAAVNYPEGYRLLNSVYNNVSGDQTAATLAYPETGLSANTAYTRYLTAFNIIGASTSSAVTTYTASTSPYGSAFEMVGGTSITITWQANGNPVGTSYQVRRWGYGETISSALDTVVTTETATLTQLAGLSTYYFRIRSKNGDGVYSGYDVELSTCTGIVTENSQSTSLTADTNIQVNMPSGMATVQIPASSLLSATNITVSATPPAFPAPTATETSITGTNVGISIVTDNGLQPRLPVSITLQYRAADIGGISPSRLFIARYDQDRLRWVPLVSNVDATNRNVSAVTNHFSLFQLMASVPASDLEQVRVFPNPWRPVTGQTSMTFINLPADTDLRVHTLRGELVRQLRANGAGMATWNGKNDYGVFVGSGVYLVRLGVNNSSKVIKVAIQR